MAPPAGENPLGSNWMEFLHLMCYNSVFSAACVLPACGNTLDTCTPEASIPAISFKSFSHANLPLTYIKSFSLSFGA